jgi:hypothetical protein
MKKKFYTWEECIQLREIKVNLPIPISGSKQSNYLPSAEFEEAQPSQHCETEGGRDANIWHINLPAICTAFSSR